MQKQHANLRKQIAEARGLRKIDLLNTLAREMQTTHCPQALVYAKQAGELALKLLQRQWKKQNRVVDHTNSQQLALDTDNIDYVLRLADSYYRIGVCHAFLNELTTARSFFFPVLDLYHAHCKRDNEVQTYEGIAYTYTREGQNELALEYCNRGIAIGKDVPGSDSFVQLLLTTIYVCCSLSRYDEALVYTKQTQPLIELAKDEKAKYRLLFVQGRIYLALNRTTEALACLQEHLELRKQQGNKLLIISALLSLGNVLSDVGEFQQALDIFQEGLYLCETIEDITDRIAILGNIANIYRILGSHETAFEHYTQALYLAESVSHLPFQAAMIEGLALVYTSWNDDEKSLEYFLRAQVLFEQIGEKKRIAYIRKHIGSVYEKLGNLEQAWDYAYQSLLLNREIRDSGGEVRSLYMLGDILFKRQKYDEAEELYLKAPSMSEQMQFRALIAEGLYDVGKLYSIQGQLEAAGEYLTKALDITVDIQEKQRLLDTYRELSELYQKQGNSNEAFRCYRESHRLEKEMFNEQSDNRMRTLQVLHQVEQAEKQKEIYRMSRDKLQQENDLHKKELASKALYLSQKNELLSKIKKELRTIATTVPQECAPPVKSLIYTIEMAMSDDRAWDIFEEQFRKVHEPFMSVLTERYPTLSASEVRVCTLLRLNLATKEIGRIMSIAQRSVEAYRYRIRKKLDCDPQESLHIFLLRLK